MDNKQTDEAMQSEDLFPENVIVLVDENEEGRPFELIGDFDFEEGSYAVVAPYEPEAEEVDETTVMVFKIVDEDGEDVLYEIEDDDEWNRVVDYWNASIEGHDDH